MEQTPHKSTPPAKRQRPALASTVDNNATRAGPVVSLLSVPLSIVFQLQPQIASIATPSSKMKEKPLLSRAEAQAFLQVHYSAQDMDALVATAEAAFRQKLKYLEYEQSIFRVDHPMTRSLLPLLRRDPNHCLKYVPAELNNGILSKLDRVAVSLKHFAEMNATTADNLSEIRGMELLAEGKNRLSELQLEVSQRISALLAHQITEDMNWSSMEEYCQRLFPNQVVVTLVEVAEEKNMETPAKENEQAITPHEVANDINLDEPSMVRDNHIDSTVVDSQAQKDPVVDKNVTFEDGLTAVLDVGRAEQESSSPALAKPHAPAPGEEVARTHESDQDHESGFQVEIPMDSSSSVIQSANNKTKDDLFGIDKENSQSQHSQHDSSPHPTLLIYGSQVSHASNHSLTCRPGAETQTAAALLSHFAVASSNDSPNLMEE